MSNETYKDRTIRQLIDFLTRNSNEPGSIDLKSGKEFIANFAAWAGKGKDEIVQLICREIGIATAAVMREPISQILSNRKLQVTFELVPKHGKAEEKKDAKKTGKAKTTKKASLKKKPMIRKKSKENGR